MAELECPSCSLIASAVTDSRPTRFRGIVALRRRRKCLRCGHRWTTYEVAGETLGIALDTFAETLEVSE